MPRQEQQEARNNRRGGSNRRNTNNNVEVNNMNQEQSQTQQVQTQTLAHVAQAIGNDDTFQEQHIQGLQEAAATATEEQNNESSASANTETTTPLADASAATEQLPANTQTGQQHSTDIPQSPIEGVTIMPTNHVALSLKKTFADGRQMRSLADRIKNATPNATLETNGEYYVITAPHIVIRKSDVEDVLGALSSPKWRMLLIKREGEVKQLNDTLFEIGEPLPVESEEQTSAVEKAQINTAISKSVKDEMMAYAELMGYSQTKYIEEAIAAFNQQIRENM